MKQWPQKRQIQHFILSLKVFAIVPFDYWVFDFADTVCVTIYFKNSILNCTLLTVICIRKDGISSGSCEHGREPLDWVYVYHPLHIKQIQRNFYRITLTYLGNRLNIRPIHQLKNLLRIKKFSCKWTFELFELLLLLLFIFMHPYNSLSICFDNIHFIISTIFYRQISWFFYRIWAISTISLFQRIICHYLTSFGEFVFETCF